MKTTKKEMVEEMQRVIRDSTASIERLKAGDYTGFRYCSGPEAAEYIIKNRFEQAIRGARRVIDDLTTPEDLA